MATAPHAIAPGAGGRTNRMATVPRLGESLVPWLVAAVVLAVLNLLVIARGEDAASTEQALLLMGLGAALAAAGLVAARIDRTVSVADLEERARPAPEELTPPPVDPGSPSYLEGMDTWTAAMLELIEHAVGSLDGGASSRRDLEAAAAETRELRDLLAAGGADALSLNDKALIHALATLWEANQPRVEQLAAEADRGWHRRWDARTVTARRLRHGEVAADPVVLPYRT